MEDREPTVGEQPLPLEPEIEPPKEDEDADAPEPKLLAVEIPPPTAGGAPSWVRLPEGMRFPKRPIIFLRFPSRWTDSPDKGEPLPIEDKESARIAGPSGLWRQCICWSNSVGDIGHALMRSKQDPNRLADELTRQMVRSIDGVLADWSGSGAHPGSVEVFWNEIGQKNRSLMNGVWSQLHTHTREARSDFFAHCVAVRSPG